MGGETVPEGVAASGLANAGPLDRALYPLLQIVLLNMMAAHFARARVSRKFTRWKNVLPRPGTVRVWIFALQSEGQINSAPLFCQVLLMNLLHTFKMQLERPAQLIRQHGHSVAQSFSVPNNNMPIAKVDILNPQSETFHEPQPASVQKFRHQPIVTFKLR